MPIKESRRVLIVDDTYEDRVAVRRFLTVDLEYHNIVEEATCAEECLLRCQQNPPDVVLLDHHLPRQDGLQILASLRLLPGFQAPVIMLTGSGYGTAASEALKGGAQDYLVKDEITPAVLSRAITNAVVKLQLERDRAEALRRTEALHVYTAALSKAVTTQQVCDAVVSCREALPELQALGVFLLSAAGDLMLAAQFGMDPGQIDQLRQVPHATPLLYQALGERQPLWIEGAADQPAWERLVRGFNISPDHSWAMLPVILDERVLGLIVLRMQPRPFRLQERSFIATLVQLFSQALDRARLYEEAQLAREDAQRHAEFEQLLLGIVSHDLRNPISAIDMTASLLLRRGTGDSRTTGGLQRILRSTQRAGRMIRDLLDFTQARLGQGIPLARSECDVFALARAVIEEMQTTAPERELRLVSEGDGHGYCDTDRVTQVLGNLVGNALKYSPATTPVEVQVCGTEDSLTLRVHNQGPPIDPLLLPHIFEPMRRGVRDNTGGSVGLGLFIVKHLVDAHGGQVAVDSSAAAGTTFTVVLPRALGGPVAED